MLPLQRKLIEKRELARQPREAVQEYQAAHGEQQNSAENFHGVQVAPKLLIEPQEAADAKRGDEKRDRKTCGIHSQQKNSLPDRVARGGDCEDAGQDGADAGRPAEGEGETHQKSAGGSGLAAEILKTNVAIEPAGERRAQQKNQGDGDEMYGLQP